MPAQAHFVARHLWPRPHHLINSIDFSNVLAERDERGALALPIRDAPPVSAALVRVSGTASVRPASAGRISLAEVEELGRLVEVRCPVAATLHSAGVALDFTWQLAPEEAGGAEARGCEHDRAT